METTEPTGILFGIACVLLFAVSFLAGDIAGIIIERQSARKWRHAAEQMGFVFDGRKRRSHSLSEFFLPKLIFPGAEETAFSFGQVMKSISGRVQGLELAINDLTVWDYHTRGPVIYRAVVCTIGGDGINLPGPIGLVKIRGVLFYGFNLDKSLKEYTFPNEGKFSASYAVFARKGSPPWTFTPELRSFCTEHRHEIDCLSINEKDIVLVWTDKSPERFPQLVDLAFGIASRLLESVPPVTVHKDS
ncbi:MAG: hypothetical protein HY912_24430 [Desulfomonile tiedjei]|uniref:Uncharacterized protein n=1 Tax=Desulfomonile tiedjei TaxID=2358 RepID=A0A9D6V8Q5_9BACT|nr:hypothetical protein [Desulfomonile tiedjei]